MADGEARLLRDWSGRTTLTWHQHLQNLEYQRADRDARNNAFEKQTVALIESQKQASKSELALMGSLNDSVRDGLSEISIGLGDLRETTLSVGQDVRAAGREITSAINQANHDITSTLCWGFSSVVFAIDQVQESLQALLKLAQTPAQTWAFEQFEIARDQIRRRLFPEALLSLDKAIDGFGSNAGFSTEFRFHYYRGLIRLGDSTYNSEERHVVEPEAAERAFLSAARYAKSDEPFASGIAMILAGRSAFAQHAYQRAIEHTEAGLQLCPHDWLACFQLAKLYSIEKGYDSAAKNLAFALALHPFLVEEARVDDDISAAKNVWTEGCKEARRRLLIMFSEQLALFDRAIDTLEHAPDRWSATEILPDHMQRLSSVRSAANNLAENNTILDVDHAIRLLSSSGQAFTSAYGELRPAQERAFDAARESLNNDIEELNYSKSQVGSDDDIENDYRREIRQYDLLNYTPFIAIATLMSLPLLIGISNSIIIVMIGVSLAYLALFVIRRRAGSARDEAREAVYAAQAGLDYQIANLLRQRDDNSESRRGLLDIPFRESPEWLVFNERKQEIATDKKTSAIYPRSIIAGIDDYSYSLIKHYLGLGDKKSAVNILKDKLDIGLTDAMPILKAIEPN